MLKDLAADADTKASEVVRTLIRSAYSRKFKGKIPGAQVAPTVRAIIDDLASPVHRTTSNLADRTGLSLKTVTETLESLVRKGIVHHCVDHLGPLAGQTVRGESENWTYELRIARDDALARLEKAGWDLDEELRSQT